MFTFRHGCHRDGLRDNPGHLLRGSGPPGATSAGWDRSPATRSKPTRLPTLAACEPTGVPSFPDPTPATHNGKPGFDTSPPPAIDQNWSQYLAAGQTCRSLLPGGGKAASTP